MRKSKIKVTQDWRCRGQHQVCARANEQSCAPEITTGTLPIYTITIEAQVKVCKMAKLYTLG